MIATIDENTQASPVGEPALSVRHLSAMFVGTDGRVVRAVEDVSFDVMRGEALGIVGESGSGKSVSVMSILGLLPSTSAEVTGGEILFEGRDLRKVSAAEMIAIRGSDIAMIFQDPMSSLNPVLTIGSQIAEAVLAKEKGIGRRAAASRAVELLNVVGVPDPRLRADQYPHQFSGGMRQRAMIAMAIANKPKILIADEPTTALDVTIQAQVLEVLKTAQEMTGAATILITHDLGVIAEFAQRVVVMYGGSVVEVGDVATVFAQPRHPYTVGLMNSAPRIDRDLARLTPIGGEPVGAVNRPSGCTFHPRCQMSGDRRRCREEVPILHQAGVNQTSACHFAGEVSLAPTAVPIELTVRPGAGDTAPDEPTRREILKVEDLRTYFPIRSGITRRVTGQVRAVDGISFSVGAGETLGIVGESGCGKSTAGRTLVRLIDPSGGRIIFQGRDITDAKRHQLREVRRKIQIVFQDPFSSLDPRMKVADLIAEPLRIHDIKPPKGRRHRVGELMELVGLRSDDGNRFAHEFSGGQRQRVGIARALALAPELLILDEPVSALDVSIQAQIINLMVDLQSTLNMSYIFIAHDLSVVRQVAHRVAVMYLGRIVEIGSKTSIFEQPQHPYTKALLSAAPIAEPNKARQRIVLRGDVPNPTSPPVGCNFSTRCWVAVDRCHVEDPRLEPVAIGHEAACILADRIDAPVDAGLAKV